MAGAKMQGKSFEEFHAQRLKTVPAGCFGDPAEFGALCAFVCSVHAARFAADKLNKAGGVLGRKVEIVSADSELKPDVATRRANHLLLGDKVDVLAMGTGSAVAKAVSQVANQNRKIFISYGTEAAVGHITADAYHITIDTPENKAYLQEWRKFYPSAPLSYKYPDFVVTRAVNAIPWIGDVINRSGSLDTDKLIKTWEGAKFKAVWGEVEMRACDHQMQTPGFVSQVLEPDQIPSDVRYWGNEFPYIGKPARITMQDTTVPPKETGNKRCT